MRRASLVALLWLPMAGRHAASPEHASCKAESHHGTHPLALRPPARLPAGVRPALLDRRAGVWRFACPGAKRRAHDPPRDARLDRRTAAPGRVRGVGLVGLAPPLVSRNP